MAENTKVSIAKTDFFLNGQKKVSGAAAGIVFYKSATALSALKAYVSEFKKEYKSKIIVKAHDKKDDKGRASVLVYDPSDPTLTTTRTFLRALKETGIAYYQGKVASYIQKTSEHGAKIAKTHSERVLKLSATVAELGKALNESKDSK